MAACSAMQTSQHIGLKAYRAYCGHLHRVLSKSPCKILHCGCSTKAVSHGNGQLLQPALLTAVLHAGFDCSATATVTDSWHRLVAHSADFRLTCQILRHPCFPVLQFLPAAEHKSTNAIHCAIQYQVPYSTNGRPSKSTAVAESETCKPKVFKELSNPLTCSGQ